VAREDDITLQINHLLLGQTDGKSLAALRVSDYFFDRLITMIDRQFQLRGRAGPEDVANSVLRVAIEGIAEGRYHEFSCREDLWALLTTIAVRRARRRLRDEHRQKRRPPGGAAESAEEPADARPDPALAAETRDQFRHLFEVLPDELRQVARWKTEDELSNAEIATRLCCAEETVRQKVLLIRARWKKELSDD
jgi:RNA polymerase sigma factor (sigma-70 family)